jgi:H+-transporting ATPase
VILRDWSSDVCSSDLTNRERRHLWSSRPGLWVVAASVGDLLIASTLAIAGIAMAPLPSPVLAGTLGAAIAFALMLDFVKVPVFRRLSIG